MSFEIRRVYHFRADRTLYVHQRSLLTMLVVDMASHGGDLHDFSTDWARWLDAMGLLLVASKEMLEHDIMANITFYLVLT
jgi:hypothetical protein